MPIIEYFLLALLGSTTSAPAPVDTTTALVTLGEEAIVQPAGALPDGGGQKKPVKHSKFRIHIKKPVHKGSHGSGNRKASHVKSDALTVKQKVVE